MTIDISNYDSVASYYLSLKYQKSTTSSSIDIGIRKFEFVTKTQFLYINILFPGRLILYKMKPRLRVYLYVTKYGKTNWSPLLNNNTVEYTAATRPDY